MTGPSHPSVRVHILAVVVPVAVAFLASLATPFQPATVGVVLVAVVVAAAVFGDRLAGWLAAVAGAAAYDFFLVVPHHSLAVDAASDIEFDLALLAVGAVVTEFVVAGRRMRRLAGERGDFLRDLSSVHDADVGWDDLRDRVTSLVARQLDADEVTLVAGPPSSEAAVVTGDGLLRVGGSQWDPAASGLPTDRYLAIPIRRGDWTVAHLRISCATHVSRPTREQLGAVALITQALDTHLIEA